MSRTLRNHKGLKYTEKTRRRPKKDKHFGWTDGTHSHKPDDMIPEKGKDFIKYGYPSGVGYPKRIRIAKKKGYPDTKHKKKIDGNHD